MPFHRIFLLHTGIMITALLSLTRSPASGQGAEVLIQSQQGVLMTRTIQRAIDSCATEGGGAVIFSGDTILTGGIELKSNVTLQLGKGAVLKGSDSYSDYRNDAFIYGSGLTHIAIQGEGVIDGVNCYNPKGEEGFRGPHCIRLINCKHITLKDFTIVNSANWAINCRYSSEATVENVSIRGGHDGLHTRFCDHFTVSGCDFRTGDDSFAGNDNHDFSISDCRINTSCNGFRMGCYNLTVKRCHFWGPGEYMHINQKRNNMLSAFVHFSPEDENPQLISGNWIIEDITVENVDRFYTCNFRNGLWQTGQPVTSISFHHIEASGILNAFSIMGDTDRQFNLEIANSSFSFREGTEKPSLVFEGAELASSAFFNAREFNEIRLREVTLNKKGPEPILEIKQGNLVELEKVHLETGNNPYPFIIEGVVDLNISSIKY
jgi:hypothetical protein